ncbi:MAG: acyl-CoA dehydrogenase family protein [Candidatus Spechtbacterales bacterium]|nr:acyl-CoA dehydrogenase family protein [Candidatus Spechtbacterales bacterium]
MTETNKILTGEELFGVREFEPEFDALIDDFCERDLRPLANEALKHEEFNEDVYNKSIEIFQKVGAHKHSIPDEYGGEKITARMATSFTRKVCLVPGAADLGLSVGAGNSLFKAPLFAHGDEELKKQLAPELASGKKDGVFAQTESEAGSHVAGIKTKATLGKDGIWRITGTKRFITGGWDANYALVLAISDEEMHKQHPSRGMSMFVVDCDEARAAGTLDSSKNEHKLGLTHSPTTEMVFTNAAAFAVLGPLHNGYKHVNLPTLGGSRATVISGQATGIGESAYDLALDYANDREQFGGSLTEKHGVIGMLEDMEARNRMSWALTLQSSTLKDEFPEGDSRPYELQASMAKLVAGEYVRVTAKTGLQVHGGNGYIIEYPIGRVLRDSFITAIYEGTSQVQSMLISRGFMSIFMSGALGGEPKDIVRLWPFSPINLESTDAWESIATEFDIYERRLRFLDNLQKISAQYPVTEPYNLPAPYFELTRAFGSLEAATLVAVGRQIGSGEFTEVSDSVIKRSFAISDGEFETMEKTYL